MSRFSRVFFICLHDTFRISDPSRDFVSIVLTDGLINLETKTLPLYNLCALVEQTNIVILKGGELELSVIALDFGANITQRPYHQSFPCTQLQQPYMQQYSYLPQNYKQPPIQQSNTMHPHHSIQQPYNPNGNPLPLNSNVNPQLPLYPINPPAPFPIQYPPQGNLWNEQHLPLQQSIQEPSTSYSLQFPHQVNLQNPNYPPIQQPTQKNYQTQPIPYEMSHSSFSQVQHVSTVQSNPESLQSDTEHVKDIPQKVTSTTETKDITLEHKTGLSEEEIEVALTEDISNLKIEDMKIEQHVEQIQEQQMIKQGATLNLTIVRGKSLMLKGENIDPDVLVKINIGGNEWTSSVKNGTKEPYWEDERHTFPVHSLEDTLAVEVYHKKLLGKNILLGNYIIRIRDLELRDGYLNTRKEFDLDRSENGKIVFYLTANLFGYPANVNVLGRVESGTLTIKNIEAVVMQRLISKHSYFKN